VQAGAHIKDSQPKRQEGEEVIPIVAADATHWGTIAALRV
jgi:hypothetical protein